MKRASPLKRGKKLRAIGKRGQTDIDALRAIRADVVHRDDYLCQRCKSAACLPLDVHHRRARSQGGEHTLDNLVTLGRPCHTAVTDHTVSDWRDWIITRKA